MRAPAPTSSREKQSIKGDIAAAFLLLTRIPVKWHRFSEDTPPDFVSALWTYPLVGLVVGGLAGIIAWGGTALSLPPMVTAVLTLLTLAMLTGAMHEDGLADLADGFGGGGTPERKAEIMHDSRIGSYGVTGLCLATAARIALLMALFNLFQGWQLALIIAIIAAGTRYQVLWLLRLFPLSDFAKLGQMTAKPSPGALAIGAVIVFGPIYWLLGPMANLMVIAVTMFVSLWVGRLAIRQIGGLTGDVMGASIIFAELAIMIAITQQAQWGLSAW